MMNDEQSVFASDDEACSSEVLERLELALFLSAVSRDGNALFVTAWALCLDNAPPAAVTEADWLADLRKLQTYLQQWLSADERPTTLGDLTVEVPFESGVVSIAQFDAVLCDAVSESERILGLPPLLDITDAHVVERQASVLGVRLGDKGPYINIAFRDTASPELCMDQMIGSRPTTASLQLGPTDLITFDKSGTAFLKGEAAAKAWQTLQEATQQRASATVSAHERLGGSNLIPIERAGRKRLMCAHASNDKNFRIAMYAGMKLAERSGLEEIVGCTLQDSDGNKYVPYTDNRYIFFAGFADEQEHCLYVDDTPYALAWDRKYGLHRAAPALKQDILDALIVRLNSDEQPRIELL